MRRLLLYCSADLEYTLAREGEDWRLQFFTVRDALERARTVVSHSTAITVYSADGTVVVESTIDPCLPIGSEVAPNVARSGSQ